jgi:hypothetical protein
MPDVEVDKGLDQFDEELDKYLAIKRKIETAFSVHGETDRNEDRALQIRLAQLNANLQYLLAGFFGFLAAGIALTVFGIQIFLDQLATYPLITVQMLYSVVVLIVATLSFIGLFIVRPKLVDCLNEFRSLK